MFIFTMLILTSTHTSTHAHLVYIGTRHFFSFFFVANHRKLITNIHENTKKKMKKQNIKYIILYDKKKHFPRVKIGSVRFTFL